MKPIRPHTTCVGLLLTAMLAGLAGPGAAQEKRRVPDDYAGAMRVGEELAKAGQFAEALQAYKKAYSLSKKSSCDALLAEGGMYRAMGDHRGALDVTKDAMKLAADDRTMQARVLNLKGAALVGLASKPGDKRYVEAEQCFRSALEASPEFHSARLNLGMTFLKQERDDEGVRELQAYLARVPAGAESDKVRTFIADPRRARYAFAPPFSFRTRQGEQISLESLKGKIVVIDFWGSWCGPCRSATPEMVKLYREYGEKGVVFLGIAQDEAKRWAAYIDKNKMEWPQYLDERSTVLRAFNVQGYPTYIVMDGDGMIRARQLGAQPGWLEAEIKRALKEK